MPKQTKKVTKKAKDIQPLTKTISKKESIKPLSKQASVKEKKESNLLELGLLLDCTGSMTEWIIRAKQTLNQIVENIVKSCDGKLKVKVCFIGYTDHNHPVRFYIKNFTEDIEDLKKYINSVTLYAGGDAPEDVVGGMRQLLDQSWTNGSSKQVFHIFDAPCHGKKYNSRTWHDFYPNGCPDGLILEDLVKEFKDKNISFTCIKMNNDSDLMIKIMQDVYPALQVSDLTNAIKTKSAEEVTKLFVENASFILRATVGVKDSNAQGNKRDTVKKGKPLWDPKKLEVDDIFSCISYLNVQKIDGNTITVKNQHGGQWIISKDLLERDMWSADHFDKELKCTMTELSGLIEQCGDTIFKVQFRKKVDEKQIESQLQSIDFSDLKNAQSLKSLSQQLIEGEQVEIVAHLVDCDNNLGRSAVIDLNAPESNNFRQVDHRSIDYIIYKNVKYSLGKKSAGQSEEIPMKIDRSKPNWNSSKLAAGNWFSQSNYYKVKKILDKENVLVATTNDPNKELKMSRDIIEYEMHSGKIYESEQKVTRTEMVNLLINAKESVFTVKFHKKVDEKFIQDILQDVKSQDQLKDSKQLKKLAKELAQGKEIEMTCFLLKIDGNLGRSSVIDLNSPPNLNYRQIDHRSIESLTLQNKKYILK